MKNNAIYNKMQQNIFISYSIVFIIFLLIGLLPIEIKNQSILFSGLFADREGRIDGMKQHLLFMYDFVRYIKVGIVSGDSLSLFRPELGLGADMIQNYTYYSLFDPLTIIAYIIPLEYMEKTYYLIMFIRMYLSGIFIILLAKKFNIKQTSSLLVLSIFYVFNVSVMFAAFRHPMFTNGPMYIPLVILGAEKLFRNERPYLLIISTFLALISQFYIFMYIAVGFEIFVLLRGFIKPDKTELKQTILKVTKVNLYFALGALLGGVILTTQLLGVMGSSRAEANAYFLYNGFDIGVSIFTFLVPAAGPHFTANIGNIFVIIIVLLYIIGKRKKDWLSFYFIILSLLVFSPLFSLLINGGTYINKRWAFLIALPSALIVGKYLERGISPSGKSMALVTKILLSSVLVGGFALAGYGLSKVIDILVLQIILWIIIGLFCVGIIFKIIKRNINLDKIEKYFKLKYLSKAVLAYSLFSLIIVSSVYLFTLTPNNAFKDYYQDEDLYHVITEDKEFFRVEQKMYIGNIQSHSNDGIFYKYRSTGNYNSMSDGDVNEFLKFFDIYNANLNVGYNGLDFRSQALNFHNVKYVIIHDSDNVLPPNGFTYFDSVKVPLYNKERLITSAGGNIVRKNGDVVYQDAKIYINENYLKFGVVYYDYVLSQDLKNTNALGRENLLLNAVILEEDTLSLNRYNNIENINPISVDDVILDGIEIDNDYYRVGWNGGTITFTIEDIIDSEVFLEINNLHHHDRSVQFDTIYQTEDIQTLETYFAYGSNMYVDNSHRFINLGYYQNKESLTVEIKLQMGRYNFDSINYYLNDVSKVNDKVNDLNQNKIENYQEKAKGFTGNINHDKTGIMVLSIPFQEGYKAYIDNIETEIHLVNKGYMGIIVPEGFHEISFEYTTPGLKIGIIISAGAAGIVCIIGLIDLTNVIINRAVKKKKQNLEQ